jgi:hypothetical protein
MKYNDKQQAILLLKDGTIFTVSNWNFRYNFWRNCDTGTTGYQKYLLIPLIMDKSW